MARQLYHHDGRAHRFFRTHVECHKVPRLPRKTTWPYLLTRRKKHVFATFTIGKASLRPRRSRTQIPPQTRRMSQSATPATQNDMTTSSDMSRKTRESHGFSTFPIDGRRRTVANGFERLRTVGNGCGHQKQGHANMGQPPDPQM